MATKQEMLEQLKAKGINADENAHPATLAKMLKEAGVDNTPPADGGSNHSDAGSGDDSKTQITTPSQGEKEGYMKISDVKALIAEALASAKQDGHAPVKIKKVTEHTAHVWRFDGKWVVDFKDRNTDPYVKEKVHAYQKFNEQTRLFEAWLELVFDDGSTKDIPLTTYIKNRVLVYCPIVKRHMVDKSYSIGEVEKKKEVGDKLVGTGVLVDQDVTMHEEVFEVRTPDGAIFMIPAYAIA